MIQEQYTAEVLDFFKHALTNQCKIFVKKNGHGPKGVELGKNQIKMLEQDPIARWIVERIEIKQSDAQSKLKYY